MKYYYIKLITFLFLSIQFCFAQQMPIDFSDSAENFNVWGGSTFATRQSPTDTNNTVGEFNRSNSPSEQGHYIDLIRSIDLDVDNTITLMFYAFDADSHTIIIKLENGANPNIEIGASTTSKDNWTELTFDFSTIGGSGKYDRLTIRIDDGSTVPGTFLMDDISDGSTPTDPNEIDIEYTDLVWADEFETNGPIDSNKWFHQTQLPAGGSWFNGEQQHYTNRIENSFVDSDNLNIVAIKEDFTDQTETKNYTSARLNSKFSFTYGRVDVKAKLPNEDGTWPAIWTLGKNINEDGGFWDTGAGMTPGSVNWPVCGEIDIMEHGLGAVNHTSSALHTPSSSGNTVNYKSQEISDVAANWHVYSVNWSPNQITFLVDGVGFYTYNPAVKDDNTWPFYKDQYILLNIAMGGIAGTIDPGFTQSSMIIDYVRVYQNLGLSTEDVNASSFKVYPNPASEEVYVDSKFKIEKLELYNILGKRVIRQTEETNRIKINNLTSGVYLLNIYSENTKTVKKVIVK